MQKDNVQPRKKRIAHPPRFKVPCNLKRGQTIWDDSKEQYMPHGFKVYWETLKKISQYQFECATGDPNVDFIAFTLNILRKDCVRKDLKCCIIGCVEMIRPEIQIYNSGLFEEIIVMDIAKGLLLKQQTLAEHEGFSNIKYVFADFNSFELKERYFDLIFAWGTVHHIFNLEYFFMQVQQSLKSNGLFAMREYVGPTRLQFTDEQLDLANALLRLLPSKYRTQPEGRIKEKEVRVRSEQLIKIDPSESIRSEEVIAVMKNYLEIVLFRPTGGALLHPLLNRIAENFEKDEEGEQLLEVLIELETILTRAELLPSDYVFVVAQSKV